LVGVGLLPALSGVGMDLYGIVWMVALSLTDHCRVVSVVSVCDELFGSLIVVDIEQLIAEYLHFF